MVKKFEDISGQKWNHLIAIEFSGRNKFGQQIWLFECDCVLKTRKQLALNNVKTGKTKSCGCETKRIVTIKHGMSGTRLHRIWTNMHYRCYNKKCRRYKDYGGMNIQIHNEWLGTNGFQNFYNWSMKNGYQDNLTIDRINNNFGYSPDNCKWSTNLEQQRRKRNNVLLTFNGKTQTISQWAEESELSNTILYSRHKRGWNDNQILTTPIDVEKEK